MESCANPDRGSIVAPARMTVLCSSRRRDISEMDMALLLGCGGFSAVGKVLLGELHPVECIVTFRLRLYLATADVTPNFAAR
tara:strand:+ start:91 stop:336 length:246 start_codon:yes stop_codon:yes gene_type:complete